MQSYVFLTSAAWGYGDADGNAVPPILYIKTPDRPPQRLLLVMIIITIIIIIITIMITTIIIMILLMIIIYNILYVYTHTNYIVGSVYK